MSSTGMLLPSLCSADLQSTHLIRQQDDKAEIVRARAEWRCKEHH
jgi:fatty acyl-ACP thioesterase B